MSARFLAMTRLFAGALALLSLPLLGTAEAQAKKSTKKESAASGMPGGAKQVATFGDWGAYVAQNGRSRLCYALSEPKSRSPANLRDTKAYLFVSFRPADKVRNEFAAILNFKTKEKGPGSLVIGDANYDLITMGENAWIKSPTDEASAINTMQKGGTMTLQAISARGNKTSDRYSLQGFSQALEQAKRDCQ